eukprot:GHVN01074809.1.p1 GENE.GHVN01074809.1~~GHVN01074809.1.p1  ORF type:complete len:114 (-),score=48.97 GHVN01074809.1:949-1254(-)
MFFELTSVCHSPHSLTSLTTSRAHSPHSLTSLASLTSLVLFTSLSSLVSFSLVYWRTFLLLLLTISPERRLTHLVAAINPFQTTHRPPAETTRQHPLHLGQ